MKGKKISYLLLLILFIGVLFGDKISKSIFPNRVINLEDSKVVKVIDGDTVKTEEGYKIRIIGINTPETNGKSEKYGKEAKELATELLLNKKVYLERDEEKEDQYGRTLAYIWIEEPRDINLDNIEKYNFSGIQLSKGYARKYTFEPNTKYEKYFKEIEDRAKKEKRGMWSVSKNGTTRGDRN